MPFHGHCFGKMCLVLGHIDADGCNRLCHAEYLIHAHLYI